MGWREAGVQTPKAAFLYDLLHGSRADALTFAVIRDCGTFHRFRDFRVQGLDQKLASKSTSCI